jgi:hypothetical protein
MAASVLAAGGLVLVSSPWSAMKRSPPAEPVSAWVVYRDAASSENHGAWTNYLPAHAGEMISLRVADRENPAGGSTAVRVDVDFRGRPWCGIAVSSQPDYWGRIDGPAFNLSGTKALSFWARGETGDEVVQIKVAIAGHEPFGDSARTPAVRTFRLSREWRRHELVLSDLDLTRVITSFAFIVERRLNGPRVTFFLDEIHFSGS